MKVAVLADPADGPILVDILGDLAEVGIDAYGLRIREGWQSLPQAEIAAKFHQADRYLIILGPRSLGTDWLTFAAGIAIGRRLGFAFYRVERSIEPPRYLVGVPVIDGRDELMAFYLSEKAEWLVREGRRSSRAALLEMGISCHADSLAQCVRDGDTKAVELFLGAGFIPDARDKHGVPLLCLAARSKHLAVAQLLLARGAELDLQSEDRGYSPLMDAVAAGSFDLAELFLSKGANPDLASKDGQTALVVAVGRNDVPTARILLQYGADPEIADKLGHSARRYATLFKSPGMLELFGMRPAEPAKPEGPAVRGRAS